MSDSACAMPPFSLRRLLWPALLALTGMLIALAAATSGQDMRRDREQAARAIERLTQENRIAQLKLAQKPEELAAAEARLQQMISAGPNPYAKYGRQFTGWDGYRYEEIADQGYLFHRPDAPEEVKREHLMLEPGAPEARWKNVVWYPLYPLIGWATARGLRLDTHIALTVVSWSCCLAGACIFFLYARRYFATTTLALPGSDKADAASRAETAALWSVAALLFGPCSIFLYANFTESLFVLLLAMFLYCLHARWWWRAAMVAAIASSSRSQGVLFGPILALTFLVRNPSLAWPRKLGIAALLGFISAIGIGSYMLYLQFKFGDALAFMHGQRYWNVGINGQTLLRALNPLNALAQLQKQALPNGEMDWPRLWEACCLIWPPIVLATLGRRTLNFEQNLMGWILWGLPYVSNSISGETPMDTPWMSMGRFMAVLLPAYLIAGTLFERWKFAGILCLAGSAATFGIFAFKYGTGAWVG